MDPPHTLAIDELPLDMRDSIDTDLDGIGNSLDLDDDDDGILDMYDDFPLDPGAWLDTDHDGMPDEIVDGDP